MPTSMTSPHASTFRRVSQRLSNLDERQKASGEK
jgi:hypothetical protein